MRFIYIILITLLFSACESNQPESSQQMQEDDINSSLQTLVVQSNTIEPMQENNDTNITTPPSIVEDKNDTSDENLTIIAPEKRKALSFFAWDGVSKYSAVLKLTQNYKQPIIYLNPIEDGTREKFESNVEFLQSHNSTVWFLLSSSGEGNNPSLEYVQSQVDIIVDYNTEHSDQIVGMIFDVEPWIGVEEQNSTDNQDMWREYLSFLENTKTILKENSLLSSAVIPFWLDNITEAFPNDRAINYDVIDRVDEVVIMDYTTYIDRFYNYAKSSLEYADTLKNKSVTIALETIDVGNDNISFFNKISDIEKFLNLDINNSSFKGYSIHTFDSFAEHNFVLKAE